jgi:hypothetical protein
VNNLAGGVIEGASLAVGALDKQFGNGTANVTNAGVIQAQGGIAIDANIASVNNADTGVIVGGENAILTITVTVQNSGTISATDTGGVSIAGIDSVTITNTRTGVISGAVGIAADGAQGTGSTITNAGTIIGTSGTGDPALERR